MEQALIDQFHRYWYEEKKLPWTTTWRGIQTVKCPFDLWVYAEIIHEVKPTLIIETGTHRGGSAIFMADCMALNGLGGRVYSIDINPVDALPYHDGVHWIQSDSVAFDLSGIAMKRPYTCMVVLDSDHSEEHVYREMHKYADQVDIGSYMIVEDSNVAGNPVEGFPGDPMAAIKRFLAERDDFEIDMNRQRYLLTQNPNGYLRRVK